MINFDKIEHNLKWPYIPDHPYRIFNHFHNILRLFDVLLDFHFTASEIMCNYYL